MPVQSRAGGGDFDSIESRNGEKKTSPTSERGSMFIDKRSAELLVQLFFDRFATVSATE